MWLLSLLLAAAPPPEPGPNDNVIVSPAHGWVLPVFTPEGYRNSVLRGDEVIVRRDDRIDVADVNITKFTGDATNRVTTIILSPEASYFPKLNLATGPTLVRVIYTANGADLTGADWTYEFHHDSKGSFDKLSIRRNVKLVLSAQLHDFLK